SPAASSTAMSASIAMRDAGARGAGSVSGIEICYQPLQHLVVEGAGHDHLARTARARMVCDALVRHEDGQRTDELFAAHGDEIIERLRRGQGKRGDLPAPPPRDEGR